MLVENSYQTFLAEEIGKHLFLLKITYNNMYRALVRAIHSQLANNQPSGSSGLGYFR